MARSRGWTMREAERMAKAARSRLLHPWMTPEERARALAPEEGRRDPPAE